MDGRKDITSGSADASASMNREQAVDLLKTLLASRYGDLREQSLMRQGKSWFHVAGMGHEATAAIALHLEADDYCAPMYRDRAFVLARGMTTLELAREFFGKRSAPNGGRQLPGHYGHRETNIWSHPSPSAAHLLPACGIAWALKREEKPNVVVAMTGDAASRQGDFYEAACVAREHRLPILFVVEDNGFGISTRTRDTNAISLGVFDDELWFHLDGRNIWDFHRQTQQVIRQLRAGKGPAFVWCEMDRISGHTSNDDQRQYRSAEELAELQQRDPLEVFKQTLVDRGYLGEQELARLEEQIRSDVRADYRRAEREPSPTADDVMTNVFGQSTPAPVVPIDANEATTIAGAVAATFRAGLTNNELLLFFGEDIEDPKGGVFKLTQGLSTEFPGRVVNSPLAESTIVGLACGLASAGQRPIFEIQFIDFASTAWNQIVTNLGSLRWRSDGKWSCPCVIYAPYGGYLPGGAIWHSQANESAFAHFPGLNVVVPSTPQDTAGLFWTAMHGDDPTLVLLPKHLLRKPFPAPKQWEAIPLGKAARVRPGHDVTIVAWGNTVEIATSVADSLNGRFDVEVVDLRSIVPCDVESVIASVEKTGRLIVVQEDTENCSVGQMLISGVMSDQRAWAKLLAPPKLISKPNVFIGFHPSYEYGTLPSADQVIAAVERVVGASQTRPAAATNLRPFKVVDSEPAAAEEHEDATPSVMTSDEKETAASLQPETPVPGELESHDVDIVVPHLGEGIYTGEVIEFLKQPGEMVSQDDPICEIESDKATMTIESSHDGQLVRWHVDVGSEVEVGKTLATVRAKLSAEHRRTRPAAGAVPAVTSGSGIAKQVSPTTEARAPQSTNAIALTRAVQVPTAGVTVNVPWETIRAACRELEFKDKPCSPTSLIGWCIAQACCTRPGRRFISHFARSEANNGSFDLGVAVALPDDELATAVISQVDRLVWETFCTEYQVAIQTARSGKIHDRRNVPIQLSTLGEHEIAAAHPLVVPPSIATLFVGAAHYEWMEVNNQPAPVKVVSLIMSFDHRLVNGVGASSFISEVKRQIESTAELFVARSQANRRTA